MNSPAPAIRNAVYFTTGVMIDEYPMIPERIFAALQKNEADV
jgi:CO/xanthine dehydrogenase Mo-binding subunit